MKIKEAVIAILLAVAIMAMSTSCTERLCPTYAKTYNIKKHK